MADIRDTIRGLSAPVEPEPAKPQTLVLPVPRAVVPRDDRGRWLPGTVPNPDGGTPRSVKAIKRYLAARFENGKVLVDVFEESIGALLDMLRSGRLNRPDGSFEALSPGELVRAAKDAADLAGELFVMLHGRGVRGTVHHTGGVDVSGEVKLDLQGNGLASKLVGLSDADFERLEALASVLMPEGIEDAEVLEDGRLEAPGAGEDSGE